MKIQSKVIATGVVIYGECYVVGVGLNHTTDANLAIYNAGSAVGAKLFATLRVDDELQYSNVMLPMPGIKCDNVYATLSAGAATLYYYL